MRWLSIENSCKKNYKEKAARSFGWAKLRAAFSLHSTIAIMKFKHNFVNLH